MTTMQEIDRLAQDYAAAREALAGTKMALDEEAAAIKRKYIGRIRKLVETGKVSSSAVHRAAEDLKAQFPDRADLLTKYADSVAPADRGRGRVAAKIGDERDYKAQKIGGNEAFIRLPLGVLEVKKGQLITVRFAADRLTACKKAG